MRKFILKKLSVLFVSSILLILLCITFFIFEYGRINDFGVATVGALILLGLILFGLILDYLLSLFIKDRIVLNITELAIVCFFLILRFQR